MQVSSLPFIQFVLGRHSFLNEIIVSDRINNSLLQLNVDLARNVFVFFGFYFLLFAFIFGHKSNEPAENCREILAPKII